MKNILKISVLIAGFALCVTENPLDKASIPVYAVSGDLKYTLKVPVSEEGTFTKSALMQVFEQHCESENPTEFGKVMNVLSLAIADQLLSQYSDDTKFSIEEVVNVVISEQKVTLPIREESNLTITLYGDLNSISSDELGNNFNTLEEFINWQQTYHDNISLQNLFCRHSRQRDLLGRISTHLTTITTSSGEVFIKNSERPGLPEDMKHTAMPLLSIIVELNTRVTQGQLDYYKMQAWEVWTKNS